MSADPETKRKFREALDRKNQKGKLAEDHKDAGSKAGGQHGAEGGPHQFRRKTG